MSHSYLDMEGRRNGGSESETNLRLGDKETERQGDTEKGRTGDTEPDIRVSGYQAKNTVVMLLGSRKQRKAWSVTRETDRNTYTMG